MLWKAQAIPSAISPAFRARTTKQYARSEVFAQCSARQVMPSSTPHLCLGTSPRARHTLPDLEPCLLPQHHNLEALEITQLLPPRQLRRALGCGAVVPLAVHLVLLPRLQ